MSKSKKAFDIERLYLKGYNHETDDFQESILIDTWLDLWSEIGVDPSLIKAIISSYGLDASIALFDNASTDYLHNAELTGIYNPVIHQLFESFAFDINGLLQCCRFPKRYTRQNLDALQTKAASDFLATNNRVKLIDRRPLPLWFERKMRRMSRKILTRYQPVPPDIFTDIPTGAAANCHRSLPAKLLQLERSTFMPSYLPVSAPIRDVTYEDDLCKVTFVPKNYCKLRTIATEPIKRQFEQTALKNYLESVLQSKKSRFSPGGRVTIHDQQRNRTLALDASTDGQLATIDLSAASDSISAKVAECVLGSLYPKALNLRTNYFSLRDRVYPKYIFCTMGQRMTFPLESLIFWIIVMMAVESYESLTKQSVDINQCSVYGDDIIVPIEIAETVIDFLSIAGFIVNSDKSCLSQNTLNYRESCGVEAVKGFDISAIFWPRHVIRPDHTGILRLIKLQNRIFKAGFRLTAANLQKRIQACFPITIPLVTDESELGFLAKIGFAPGYKLPASVSGVSVPIRPISRLETRPVLSSRSATAIEKDAYDRFCYYNYLSNGPLYSDPVCELAGVSTSRYSQEVLRGVEQDGSDPAVRIVVVYDWTV